MSDHVRLSLSDAAKQSLAEAVSDLAMGMRREVAEGRNQSNRHLILRDRQFHFYHYKRSCGESEYLLIHLIFTSKKGMRMFYYNDLAGPGTDVWDAVRTGLGKEDR